MEEQIKAKLEEIRGMLQNDGGDVELVAIEGKNVKVRLQGHCVQCAYAQMTLKNVIEAILQEKVDPEITVDRVEE